MSFDVVTISGIFALAFLIHNLIIQIMRYNRNAHNNTRDLGIAYFLSGTVYAALGVLGGMAVSWRPNCNAIDFKDQKSKVRIFHSGQLSIICYRLSWTVIHVKTCSVFTL